jgi:uncharacterized protein YcgL (UPF0745 family)
MFSIKYFCALSLITSTAIIGMSPTSELPSELPIMDHIMAFHDLHQFNQQIVMFYTRTSHPGGDDPQPLFCGYLKNFSETGDPKYRIALLRQPGEPRIAMIMPLWMRIANQKELANIKNQIQNQGYHFGKINDVDQNDIKKIVGIFRAQSDKNGSPSQ